MAHYEIELPGCHAFGAEGGPVYNTQVVTLYSGFEKRNKNFDSPLREYRVSYPPKRKSLYDDLISFMEVIGEGRANSFLFVDPFDYEVTAARGVLTEAGADSPDTIYQMYFRRTYGGNTKDRKIQKPRSGTVTIYNNGVAMGSGFSIDYATGLVEINSALVGPFTWAGEFCVPLRFDADPMQHALIQKAGSEYLIEWRGIPLKEVRVS